MTDFLTKKQRSLLMSKVRGKWTGMEKRVHNNLKGRKIEHKMHPNIVGNPDILLKKSGTAVFLDGCFWHGCSKCYVKPKTNALFWRKKIERNMRNDIACNRVLRRRGLKVIRLWECELEKDFQKQVMKLH